MTKQIFRYVPVQWEQELEISSPKVIILKNYSIRQLSKNKTKKKPQNLKATKPLNKEEWNRSAISSISLTRTTDKSAIWQNWIKRLMSAETKHQMKDSHGWRTEPKDEGDSDSYIPGNIWSSCDAGGWSDITVFLSFLLLSLRLPLLLVKLYLSCSVSWTLFLWSVMPKTFGIKQVIFPL